MTVPQEDVERRARDAHRAMDETVQVIERLRGVIDNLLVAIDAANERQRKGQG